MPRIYISERQLPFAKWPAIDRQSWGALFRQGDLLTDEGPAAHWAAATRKTNRNRYARFLGFLAEQGMLVDVFSPAHRITPDAVEAYGRDLMASLSPKTVEGLLVALKVVAKVFAPSADWRWFDTITARLKRWARPSTDPDAGLVPIAELYDACLAELDRIAARPPTRCRDRLAFRDTLIVAFFTVAPIRIRNMEMIDVDRHLVRRDGYFELCFVAGETKNGRPLRMPLPAELTAHVEYYLTRVRPRFAAGGSAALWPRSNGGRLALNTIYQRVVAISRQLTGVPINPHRFRAIAATAMADHSPQAARLAAPLLGHAYFGTTEAHYIRSRQIEASRRIITILDAIRAEDPEET